MNQAGDYKLESIIVHSASGPIDIKSLMVELNVYESIFSPAIYGNIVIADSANHIQNMPLIGQEEIEFKIRIDDNPDNETIDFKTRRARIYKISDQVRTAERQQVYTLHFTSQEAIENQRVKVKGAFNATTDQIVANILQNIIKTKKSIAVEQSSLHTKVIGNQMTPFDFIKNILCKRSSSKTFKDGGYTFFESHRGYMFTSYQRMWFRAPGQEVNVQENYIVQPSKRDSSIAEDMKSVLEYKIMKGQDTLAGMATGLLASKHFVYDTHKKKLTITPHNYYKNFIDSVHAADGTLFTTTPEKSDGKTIFEFNDYMIDYNLKDTGLHTDTPSDNHIGKLATNRFTYLSHDQLKAKITVFGNTNLAAGDIIHLRVPSYEPVDKTTTRVHDAFLSGRWLLTNVVHTINNTRYTTTFDCVRDSVEQPYNKTSTSIEETSNDYNNQ